MFRLLIFMALSCPALAQETGSALPYSSVYDEGRSEQLIARGLLQMEERDFRAAEKTFIDAVQVAKVNYGLRAPKQRAALSKSASPSLTKASSGACVVGLLLHRPAAQLRAEERFRPYRGHPLSSPQSSRGANARDSTGRCPLRAQT